MIKVITGLNNFVIGYPPCLLNGKSRLDVKLRGDFLEIVNLSLILVREYFLYC
jgi:hypothetical protein